MKEDFEYDPLVVENMIVEGGYYLLPEYESPKSEPHEVEPIAVGIEAERAPAGEEPAQEVVDRVVHELFRHVLTQEHVDKIAFKLIRGY